VSRIEQALRRISRDTGAGTGPAEGHPDFEPAWEVSPPTPKPSTVPFELRNNPAVSTAPKPIERSQPVSFSSACREKLAAGPQGDPALIEQFRRLAGVLHQAQGANGVRRVMVTSAEPGDGKTLTAVNLALVLAASYRREVLLVDADLRCPSIPFVVELGDSAGLSEALQAKTDRPVALAKLAPGLTLLPAGHPIGNSIEALTSPRMHEILDEADDRFDWVILDAPPVGATADARLLADMVGGALFVVHAGRTQYADVQKAIESLGRERIIGVVLNGVDSVRRAEHYYYGAAPRGGRR
jgi:protein-tyrosine kinase